MTSKDWPEFMRLCALLSQAFDKSMAEPLMRIYFDGLKDFTIDEIDGAVKQAVTTKTFLPKVAELRQLIEGSLDDRASQAWAAFLEAAADGPTSSAYFSDRATAAAVDAVFGGWLPACRMLAAGWVTEDGDHKGGCTDEMVAHYQKSFLRQYTAAANRAQEVEQYRPGLSEMSLRERGASWADRMPTLLQPVIFVGHAKSVSLRLPFDVARGELTAEARAAIGRGWEAVRQLAADHTPRLAPVEIPALPPAPVETVPMPAEVEQALAEWQDKARMPEPDPEEVREEILAAIREKFAAFDQEVVNEQI